ncbi:FAD-binding and (Fe-S)-binding domain-containing protein [Paraphotobacterium marinum]|uniref:FAD-binding and (Fe-S)-binding domain-containing protein n=1 Tax=Paraphotobacterium marinum TaxID=1755811 RepID=UPI0039E823BF
MLNQLNPRDNIPYLYRQFFGCLSECENFLGEIDFSYSTRIIFSTDNSIYQKLPIAVLYPKSEEDIIILSNLLSKQEFSEIFCTSRGGGTGTNGQSLNRGIIVDFSKYMTKILNFNLAEKWVEVETGIVKDKLNDFLKPHGLFFAPDTSTSNRATIGGMINTDASGQGSLRYGKTSDNVLGLNVVLPNGQKLVTSKINTNSPIKNETLEFNFSKKILGLCSNNRTEIKKIFPDLNRFLTGYDLNNVTNFKDQVDLSKIFCGSEGTLGFVTKARLKLIDIPQSRILFNILFDTFDSALKSAPTMLDMKALSVETIDSKVFNLAKKDNSWRDVKAILDPHDSVNFGVINGINFVEYASNDPEENEVQAQNICKYLDEVIKNGKSGIKSYSICRDEKSILSIYGMRKKAVGLLGAVKGYRKPVPFAEDTCVPPQNLLDFILEYRALLDRYKLDYGMFGHVDAGVLHVRPCLDLTDESDENLLKTISDSVVELVCKYNGLMWGEHGKGYRSEYVENFFGTKLYNVLRMVKTLFDPHNQMNPGKICSSFNSNVEIVKVIDHKKSFYDKQISINTRTSFKEIFECNGNGLCFNYDSQNMMCPSWKVTNNRSYSPKGRASLFREWIRLITVSGQNISVLEKKSSFWNSFYNFFRKKRQNNLANDFSLEVKQSMDECLACKACSSQCPIKINIPEFRSRFYNIFYTRYYRHISDYAIVSIEKLFNFINFKPSVFNRLISLNFTKKTLKNFFGLVDLPKASNPSIRDYKKKYPSFFYDSTKKIENINGNYVFILQDAFTSLFDAELIIELAQFLEKLNFNPVILPYKASGKAAHVKGFLNHFKKIAEKNINFLNQFKKNNIPIIGLDAATVLLYRDEYRKLIGEKLEVEIQLINEFLFERLNELELPHIEKKDSVEYYLFTHCTEKSNLIDSDVFWKKIFAKFDLKLNPISTGCCGMAGTYGHENKNFENSKKLYELSWKKYIDDIPNESTVISGYSCRSQIKRLEGRKSLHPFQVLNRYLN